MPYKQPTVTLCVLVVYPCNTLASLQQGWVTKRGPGFLQVLQPCAMFHVSMCLCLGLAVLGCTSLGVCIPSVTGRCRGAWELPACAQQDPGCSKRGEGGQHPRTGFLPNYSFLPAALPKRLGSILKGELVLKRELGFQQL